MTFFQVLNPSNSEIIGNVEEFEYSKVDKIIGNARIAFEKWSSISWNDRIKILQQCLATLMKNEQTLAELLTKEQGKPIMQAHMEIRASAFWLKRAISRKQPDKILFQDANLKVEQKYKPVGVVGCITAWNFPLLLVHFKISEALLSGCTIVLKPSEHTPLTTLRLAELYNQFLPPGVFNIITGQRRELGAYLVTHPGIDKISFTGSTAVGQAIQKTIGLKPYTLELGGNDAMIVLQDVDPKIAAKSIFNAAFSNCGQICLAAKRVFVASSIFDNVCAAMSELLTAQVCGDGFDKNTTIGPVNNAIQYIKVRSLLLEALKQGAQIVHGSVPPELPQKGGGYFFPPVVLRNVHEGMKIVDEEQFGPVLPLLRFDSIDEVIQRANATTYGLGGSVWTNDVTLGTKLAERLECGTSWVNSHGDIVGVDDAPFGGVKLSGVGMEGGQEGLLGFMKVHIVKTRNMNSKI